MENDNEMPDDLREILIDNSVPVSSMLAAGGTKALMIQHGGVCTKLNFDRLERMDSSFFLRKIASSMPDDNLAVMVNRAGDKYALLYAGKTLLYHVTSARECLLDDMATFIKSSDVEQAETTLYNMTYPLVADINGRSRRSVTVLVPSARRTYKSSDQSCSGMQYWAPDVWFSVCMNSSGLPLDYSVCVCLNYAIKMKDTKLVGWPLANVWDYCRICTGDVQIDSTGVDIRQLEDQDRLNYVINGAVDGFFDSNFNRDLLSDNRLDMDRLSRLVHDGKSYSQSGRCKPALMHMASRDGWRSLPYTQNINPDNYIARQKVWVQRG